MSEYLAGIHLLVDMEPIVFGSIRWCVWSVRPSSPLQLPHLKCLFVCLFCNQIRVCLLYIPVGRGLMDRTVSLYSRGIAADPMLSSTSMHVMQHRMPCKGEGILSPVVQTNARFECYI